MGKASLDLTVLDLRTEAQGAEYEKNNNDCSDQPDDIVHTSSHVSSYARWSWRLACHPRSGWFECRSHTVKFFQTPRRGHPSGYPMTMNFRWKKIAAIYQHALEPNVPPINFFGSLVNTNSLMRTHGTSPRSSLNLVEYTKVPVGATLTKSGGHRRETAAPISAAIYEYNSPSIRNCKSLGAREVLRLFVIAITAPIICSYRITITTPLSAEVTMRFNYLTNSGGFTRIAAYVHQLVDNAVDARIETISQSIRPDPASRCLNRPCELSEFMSRTIAP